MSDREVSPSQTTRDYCHLLEIQKSKNDLPALLSTGHRRWHNLNAAVILNKALPGFFMANDGQRSIWGFVLQWNGLKSKLKYHEIVEGSSSYFWIGNFPPGYQQTWTQFWLNGFARHVIREYTHKAEPKGWQPPVNTFLTKSFITNFRNCAPEHLAFQGWESEAECELY